MLIVPMNVRGRTLGAMTFVTTESLRRFGPADTQFAERIAARAAIAVDNARLASARRDIAATLQNSLLPSKVPSIDGWEIATLYRPAGTAEEVEVAGDFYDFFETPAGWFVLLGDVTGKGAPAAARTSLLRHRARFLAKHDERPSRILAGLDEALRDEPDLPPCSAVCLHLRPGRLVVASVPFG